MKAALFLAAGLAALTLTACSEPPAGEAVTKIRFDGSQADEPVPGPAETPEETGPSACEAAVFEGVALTHCVADPALHRIEMVNAGAGKQPFGGLAAFAATVQPADIAFAMNGGMYGDDLKPIGYFVQNGERMKELDRGDGGGNLGGRIVGAGPKGERQRGDQSKREAHSCGAIRFPLLRQCWRSRRGASAHRAP